MTGSILTTLLVFGATPAVLVTCRDKQGKANVLTLAWTGIVCSEPAMVSISVRRERHSHGLISRSQAFVINLTSRALAYATDWCGMKSGRSVDKFKTLGLKPIPARTVAAPGLAEFLLHGAAGRLCDFSCCRHSRLTLQRQITPLARWPAFFQTGPRSRCTDAAVYITARSGTC